MLLLFELFAALSIVSLLVAIVIAVISFKKVAKKTGQKIDWILDADRKTEIISNKALEAIQCIEEKGGILRPGDVIIVWAQEFLDDDILYDAVLQNIRDGVKYLYVLDVFYAERFARLLRRLYDDESDSRLVEEGVDVLFVRNDLTLNNFVCMAAEDGHRRIMYSSVIYERRPIGWIRQSACRSVAFINRTKQLLAAVAISQSKSSAASYEPNSAPGYSERIFEVGEQIMDFSKIAERRGDAVDVRPEHIQFNISEEIGRTMIDFTAIAKSEALYKRFQQQRDQLMQPVPDAEGQSEKTSKVVPIVA